MFHKGEIRKFARAERLHFYLIKSLWREREGQRFVLRRDLQDELMSASDLDGDCDDDQAEMLRDLAYEGIGHTLDCSAMSGPDFDLFRKVAANFGDYGLPVYWRYKVTRDGAVGYVKKEDLTEQEREEMQTELLKRSYDAQREAQALEEEMRRSIFVVRRLLEPASKFIMGAHEA